MIVKLLVGLLVVYAGWLLWRGPKRRKRVASPADAARVGAAASDAELVAARSLLGVSADAGEAEIKAAYRRIAAAVHPDRGGSAELARRVNAARDLLLKPGPDRAT
ncbi:MAG: J domain-containing protein [Sphingomonas sp.]|nr:J domain-containing protein [Sphingomonas sp.]